MVVSEMHTQFKVGYDKVDSLGNRTYTPEEIDIFLNNAQNLILSNVTKEGLESNIVLRNYTRPITENLNLQTFISNADNKPNGKFVQLPSNIRLVLEEEITITYVDCNNQTQTKRITVTPTTHDRYNRVVRNPFTSPYDEEVYQLPCTTTNLNNAVELIGDGTYTFNTYHIRYIREPNKIQYGSQYVNPLPNVDCELGTEQAQKEVVATAVLIALGRLGNVERYQTQALENRELR